MTGAPGAIALGGGGGAGVAAIGRSALRPIASPHAGQKWSPLPWIAAHRGHAAMPASRSTVIDCPLRRTPSSARSSASKMLNTESFAATSSSWRLPRRCISNTRPPRSRYASSRALRRKRARRRIRPRSTKPGEVCAPASVAGTPCALGNPGALAVAVSATLSAPLGPCAEDPWATRVRSVGLVARVSIDQPMLPTVRVVTLPLAFDQLPPLRRKALGHARR